jgi:signal transduction histidine kinase
MPGRRGAVRVEPVFTRTEYAIAAACAGWAAAFLAGEGALLAFAPAFGVAVLPHRRRPILAALAVAAVVLVAILAGVSEESPAALAAGLTATYALGRRAGGAVPYLPVVALAAALTAVDGLTWADAAFVMFILTATWTCGRLVRRRAEHAERAAAVAAELAARDPAVLAARVVAEERARLAGEALDVIRRAVERMRREAVAAEPELDSRPLAAIQDDGTAAVTELRRLLGLLRAEPEPAPPTPPPPPRRRPWIAVAIAAALMALCGVDAAAWDAESTPGSIVLTLAFAASVALVPVDVAIACLAASVPSLLALGLDSPLVYGFSTVLACGVLAWSAGSDGRPRALAALAAFVLVTLVAVHEQSPGNEGILLGAAALTGAAGHAWGRRDREGALALADAARLRAEQEAATERAVRAERLRLARELHDVASHAVAAMMLQAGAALALRGRDPDAARAAVRVIQASGTEAISELDVLFGLLDAGAVGPAGLAAPHAERDLGGAISALAERMRAGGLEVVVAPRAGLPDDPVLVAAAYRIVQEALTNAARYAPGSRVEVGVEVTGGLLQVTVRDHGGRRTEASTGGGFGLVGLAERVRALGGDLAAGPAPGGGFAVTARLPA